MLSFVVKNMSMRSPTALRSDHDPAALTVHAKPLVFEDPLSRQLLRELRRIAPSNATVLISGETGTGKEIVARYVHELSQRSERPFVAVSCFSETLIDSELFGHEKGSFTGATSTRMGWFEAAQGGTLFLDEVGDLPMQVQVKLLRVLQEREIVPVGSRHARRVDVRLVAATNVNLESAIRAGRFREDLYFRLNVVALRVPALRERPGDIVPLATDFLRMFAERERMGEVTLTAEAISRLLDHSWPGNVRELENVMHRAVLTCQDGRVEVGDLPLSVTARETPEVESTSSTMIERSLDGVLADIFERGWTDTYQQIDNAVISHAYRFCHRNQLQTARLLGISRNVLRSRLAKLGYIAARRSISPDSPDPEDTEPESAPSQVVGSGV